MCVCVCVRACVRACVCEHLRPGTEGPLQGSCVNSQHGPAEPVQRRLPLIRHEHEQEQHKTRSSLKPALKPPLNCP